MKYWFLPQKIVVRHKRVRTWSVWCAESSSFTLWPPCFVCILKLLSAVTPVGKAKFKSWLYHLLTWCWRATLTFFWNFLPLPVSFLKSKRELAYYSLLGLLWGLKKSVRVQCLAQSWGSVSQLLPLWLWI